MYNYTITGNEKWIYFENPKKSWVDPGAPSTSTARANRFGRKTMLRIWWDQRSVAYNELLNPKLLNVTNNNWPIWIEELTCLKIVQNTERGNTKSFFFMTMLHHVWQNRFATRTSIQLGSSIPCCFLTRLGSFKLTLLCIDGSRTCWAAFWFVRRWEKMSRWMVRSKRERILRTWYS